MCVRFPVPVTITEETKQLVLLEFPLDGLYNFFQEYDKWLLGFRGLKLLILKYNLNVFLP